MPIIYSIGIDYSRYQAHFHDIYSQSIVAVSGTFPWYLHPRSVIFIMIRCHTPINFMYLITSTQWIISQASLAMSKTDRPIMLINLPKHCSMINAIPQWRRCSNECPLKYWWQIPGPHSSLVNSSRGHPLIAAKLDINGYYESCAIPNCTSWYHIGTRYDFPCGYRITCVSRGIY